MKFIKSSLVFVVFSILLILSYSQDCQKCYNKKLDKQCGLTKQQNIDVHTLHMSVHPHLDAFWIYKFQDYYKLNESRSDIASYFGSNRFSSVSQIFSLITKLLYSSKALRESSPLVTSQSSQRSFFNSEIGFLSYWYKQQNSTIKGQVKQLLKTKYWEVLGGGIVQHDQGCSYYEDIIVNFQQGLTWLNNQFGYIPKVAISADSFGHSQTTLAILAHLGIQGYFVERSDQNLLLQNKTQFIWKAKSANGQSYGALPTHIRWAIHGFQDQFIDSGQSYDNMCKSKETFINRMRSENQFLKKILKSDHIMRYFGHDFQKFDQYSYSVIETIMAQFSKQKCNKIIAVYGNPTQYFLTLMGEVFGKRVKKIQTRQEDIFPIWDFDSGLFWTGYFTTDPYHKKIYRDAGRYLHALRKASSFLLIRNGFTGLEQQKMFENLQDLSYHIAYLQHHDGISGTSKYEVLDHYQVLTNQKINKSITLIMKPLFETFFPLYSNNPILYCFADNQCKFEQKWNGNDLLVKAFNSDAGNFNNKPFVIVLPQGKYYQADSQYEINCFCQEISACSCSIYLYPQSSTLNLIRLRSTLKPDPKKINYLKEQIPKGLQKTIEVKSDCILYTFDKNQYKISYKKLQGGATARSFSHLSRYGQRSPRRVSIRSGKYALGNNPNKIEQVSKIQKVLYLQSEKYYFIIIKWKRQQMKTKITIKKQKSQLKLKKQQHKTNSSKTSQLKVQTYASAQGYQRFDYYLVVQCQAIKNKNIFYTDSNGWLVMKREMFKHQDYKAQTNHQKMDDFNSNTYPTTIFSYIQDRQQNLKLSISSDRPQGVLSYTPGSLWINIDRLTDDDGKWVYETTHRSQYHKFVHVINIGQNNNHERDIQKGLDQARIVQLGIVEGTSRIPIMPVNTSISKWIDAANIQQLKFMIKPEPKGSIILRVHNLKDQKNTSFFLFSNKILVFLTAFYQRIVQFDQIEQLSLGGNMKYSQFLQNKWNWNTIVDLKKQNSIFNKEFKQQIELRPLQIRTFRIKGIKFSQKSIESESVPIATNKTIQRFVMNTQKDYPHREEPILQQITKNYFINGDHCHDQSPVLPFKKRNIAIKPQQPVAQLANAKVPQIIKIQQVQTVNNQNQTKQGQKQLVQAKKPIREYKLSYQQILEKVFNLKPLTKQQKHIFFMKRVINLQVEQ